MARAGRAVRAGDRQPAPYRGQTQRTHFRPSRHGAPPTTGSDTAVAQARLARSRSLVDDPPRAIHPESIIHTRSASPHVQIVLSAAAMDEPHPSRSKPIRRPALRRTRQHHSTSSPYRNRSSRSGPAVRIVSARTIIAIAGTQSSPNWSPPGQKRATQQRAGEAPRQQAVKPRGPQRQPPDRRRLPARGTPHRI